MKNLSYEYNESGLETELVYLYWEAAMNIRKFNIRNKLYPIVWVGIIMISMYLLIRFLTISFVEYVSDDKRSVSEAAVSYLVRQGMEDGSALMKYTMDQEQLEKTFPFDMVGKKFALGDFITDSSLLVIKANELSEFEYSQNEAYSNSIEDKDNTQTVVNTSQDEAVAAFENGEGMSKNLLKILAFDDSTSKYLDESYRLTNGSRFYATGSNQLIGELTYEEELNHQLSIGYVKGDVAEDDTTSVPEAVEVSNPGNLINYTMDQLKDVNFLVRHFYIVDGSTKVTEELFNAEKLIKKDMTIKQDSDKPQILIYHTHSQETYADSKPGAMEDTVVGVGSLLAQILEEDYGYNVIHDKTTYDLIDGKLDRNYAYTKAEKGIGKILDENPTIEVVIDLHRDGSAKRSTLINGEETAQVMLFNGLSRDQNGPITYLDNPNLQNNLAFSLQLQLKGVELYPGLFYRNFLKCYRYNMHVRPKCLLIELGTDKNTLQSAKNAMEPFAEVLDYVLQGY